MNQALISQRDATQSRVETYEEPRTEPRIRIPPLPATAPSVGRKPHQQRYTRWLHALHRRLGLAPALVVGAVLGSAPYLVEQCARTPVLVESGGDADVEATPLTTLTAAASGPALRAETPEQQTAPRALATAPERPEPPARAEARDGSARSKRALKASSTTRRRAVERSLLTSTSARLRRGDSFGAQLSLQELERRVPNGALMQERKWLEIQVLRAVGADAAARLAASDFARAYPHSARLPQLAKLLLGS